MKWELALQLRKGRRILEIYIDDMGSKARIISRRANDDRAVVEDWLIVRATPRLDDFFKKLEVGE